MKKRSKNQPTAMEAYMNEVVVYGGEEMTRADMIRDLQKVARAWAPGDTTRQQLMVGRYLQGLNQFRETNDTSGKVGSGKEEGCSRTTPELEL